MAKIRNTSPDTLVVPLLGRTIAPDELVELDDAVFEAHAWPESTWTVVTEPKVKAAAAKPKNEEQS